MHGQRFLVRELQYGSDGANLYLRLDFEPGFGNGSSGLEAQIRIAPAEQHVEEKVIVVLLQPGSASNNDPEHNQFAFQQIFEGKIQLTPLGIAPGRPVRFQMSLWQSGLPLGALPPQGFIEVPTAEPSDWPL